MNLNRSLTLAYVVMCWLFVPAIVRAGDDDAKKKDEAIVQTTREALQTFLAKQTNDEIDDFAKEVKSVIKGWKKRAKKELGEQDSNTLTFNSAYSIIELAKDEGVKAKKITHVLSSLDKLKDMKDVAALRAVLESYTKTAPNAKDLAQQLLKEAAKHFLSDVEREALEELIDAASKDSFEMAIERLEDGENELFAKMAGD